MTTASPLRIVSVTAIHAVNKSVYEGAVGVTLLEASCECTSANSTLEPYIRYVVWIIQRFG